eukprot:TRINITY_DN57250_c0_g1_i1.p1 TRINITY_DN57250_c0_g1~~TRINITY_DN57250_c0_g1_i1.p1  ORF type:complete len:231 (+),score=47.84 TRINITY_DN57250_c0_g1_i1:45-695(+)
MAQTLRRQARALEEEAAALPTLGPKVRASDIDQIKRGISAIASLASVERPEPEELPQRPGAEAEPAEEQSVPAPPTKAAPKKAPRKIKPVPTAAAPAAPAPTAVAAKKAKAQKPSPATAAGQKPKIQKAIGKGASRGRRSLSGISKPELRRLARRAGVQRMASTIYDEMRGALASFLSEVVDDVTVYAEYGRRKTATPSDVVYSLRRRGKALYGYT